MVVQSSKITSRRGSRDRDGAMRKGDERQEAILDSAETRLSAAGAAALTIEDVARGAGLSRPSVYFYFASKAELLAALVARVQHKVQDASDSSNTLRSQGIHAALTHTAELWREHAAVLRLGVELAADTPEIAREYDAAFARLVAGFMSAVEAEVIDRDDPAILRMSVEALALMSERSFHRLFTGVHTRADEAALVSTLSTLWIRGLGLSQH